MDLIRMVRDRLETVARRPNWLFIQPAFIPSIVRVLNYWSSLKRSTRSMLSHVQSDKGEDTISNILGPEFEMDENRRAAYIADIESMTTEQLMRLPLPGLTDPERKRHMVLQMVRSREDVSIDESCFAILY